MLRNINENNQEHARRLLHCLAVAVRPLRIEELAEILSFDYDAAEGSIPKFHPDRRPRNPEHAILSICSSLIAIVHNRGSRVVQFSHLSVKEFLTSSHLASSTGHLGSYHILLGPAHTIFAQVCLGLLTHPKDGDHDKSVRVSPLSEYAARYWVTHAQFEDVVSRVMDGIHFLFDQDQPHFAVWVDLYDIDAESGGQLPPERPSPLYYSALCGFHGLVRHIAIKHPQDANAIGGSYGFPIVAALCRNHFEVADLLLELGGRVDIRDTRKQTVLHRTIDRHDKGTISAVQFLLEHGADVNAKRDDLCTPLHLALNVGNLKAARMLIEHHADVNARNDNGQAPLHLLSRWELPQDEDERSNVAKQLLKRGANMDEKDKDDATPLHLASYYRRLEIVQVLLDHGASIDIENNQGKTPLRVAITSNGRRQGEVIGISVARLLLAHGAEAYARDKYPISTSDLVSCFGKEKIAQVLFGNGDLTKPESTWDEALRLWTEGDITPNKLFSAFLISFLECGVDGTVHKMYETILLHSASYQGTPEMVGTLLNLGVKLNATNHWGETILHLVSRGKQDSQGGARIAKLLLERGVDVNTRRMGNYTPLHVACCFGKPEIVRLLLDHGADANVETEYGMKLLHQVSFGFCESQEDGVRVAELLLEHDADVNIQDNDHLTPLHIASRHGKLEIVRLLLDRGAEVNAESDNGENPLHTVSYGEYISQEDGVRVAQLLLERGADVNARRHGHRTPLHLASYVGNLEIVRLLLDHGADPEVNAEDHEGDKPLHKVSYGEYESQEDGMRIAQLLLEHGADVNTRRNDDCTPLHLAAYYGNLEIVRLLLNHGADQQVNAEGDMEDKPLHKVSGGRYSSREDGVRIAQLLLERGAVVNARRNDHQTPLHSASHLGKFEMVQLLIDHGAEVDSVDDFGNTPLHNVSQGKYEFQEDGVRAAQILLDHGADVNATTESGITPLASVSRNERPKLAELLHEHAANVNAVHRDRVQT